MGYRAQSSGDLPSGLGIVRFYRRTTKFWSQFKALYIHTHTYIYIGSRHIDSSSGLGGLLSGGLPEAVGWKLEVFDSRTGQGYFILVASSARKKPRGMSPSMAYALAIHQSKVAQYACAVLSLRSDTDTTQNLV